MTLSRFFRDYVYFPLGGSLFGIRRQMVAIMITMVLCGLWHGASWPTTLWGVFQGIVLIINVLWRKTGIRLPQPLAWSMTMLFWIFSLAIFRSATVAAGGQMLLSLVGINGISRAVADVTRPWQVLLYAIPAVVGPTSQKLALKWLRARPAYAVAIAVALLLLVLKIGDAGYSEFIYFQF
jgi:D-alanyl-lipoteichoic acid acyltransferase DltB (MBOAT superfamily)